MCLPLRTIEFRPFQYETTCISFYFAGDDLNDTGITPTPLSTLARAQAVEKLDRQFLLNYLETVQKEKEIMTAENRKVNTFQIELAIVKNELDVVKREKQCLDEKFNLLKRGYDRCVNERGQITFDFESAVQKIGSLQKDLLAMKKENQSLKAIGKEMSPSCDTNFDLKIPSELCYKIHVETLNKDNMLLKKENQSLKDMLCSTAKSISNEENNLARLRQNIDKTLQKEASPNNSLESIMTSSGQSGLESPTESGQNQTVTPLISSPNSASAHSRVASESRQNIDDSVLYPKNTWCNEKMLDDSVTKNCLVTPIAMPTSMPQSQEIATQSPNDMPIAMPTSMPKSQEITTQSRIAMPTAPPIAEPTFLPQSQEITTQSPIDKSTATPIDMPTSMPQSQEITTQSPIATPTFTPQSQKIITQSPIDTPAAMPITIPQPKSITSKIWCKNFLVSLLEKTSSIAAPTIQHLVQDLIYGRIEPQIFMMRLSKYFEIGDGVDWIARFLKLSLPSLRESIKSGEFSVNEFTLANISTVPKPRISMSNGKSISLFQH